MAERYAHEHGAATELLHSTSGLASATTHAMTGRGMSAEAVVRLEQEDLDLIKKAVLIHHRRLLVDSIDPVSGKHLPHLRSKFILDEKDEEEIRAPVSRSERAEVFLDKLGRKGAAGYDEFCESLCRDRTQLFILNAMTKTVELLKHNVLRHKAQQAQVKARQQRSQAMNPNQPQQKPTSHPHIPPLTTSHQASLASSHSGHMGMRFLSSHTHPHPSSSCNSYYQSRGNGMEESPCFHGSADDVEVGAWYQPNKQGLPRPVDPQSPRTHQTEVLDLSPQDQPCGQPV